MHHLRTAHAIICGVAIRLEKSFEVAEEVQRALALTAHTEIKNRHAPRRPVLPEIRLMVCAASVMRLNIDRSFIRLDVGCRQATGFRIAPATGINISPMVITQPHIVALLISMPASRNKATLCRKSGLWSQYFVHHRVDDHSVRHQAFIDDPDGKSRRRHALLGTGFAGPLLALGHLHEIPRRLDIQHFADFVADHSWSQRRSCRIRTAPACRQSPVPHGEDSRAESDVRDACVSFVQ